MGIAASLFNFFFFFLTKENIVKFLIKQKRNRELRKGHTKQHSNAKAFWRNSIAYLSHPMMLYMPWSYAWFCSSVFH